MTYQEINKKIEQKIAKLQKGRKISVSEGVAEQPNLDKALWTEHEPIRSRVYLFNELHPEIRAKLRQDGPFINLNDVISLTLIPGFAKPKITADDPAVQKLVQEKLAAKGYAYDVSKRKIIVVPPTEDEEVDTETPSKTSPPTNQKPEGSAVIKTPVKSTVPNKGIPAAKPNEFPSNISLQDAFKLAQGKGFKSFKWDGVYYITELGAEKFTKNQSEIKLPTIEQLTPKPRELSIVDREESTITRLNPKKALLSSVPKIEINPKSIPVTSIPDVDLSDPDLKKVPAINPFKLETTLPTITKIQQSAIIPTTLFKTEPKTKPQESKNQPEVKSKSNPSIDTTRVRKPDTVSKPAILYPPVSINTRANTVADSLDKVLPLNFKKSFTQTPNIRTDTSASFLSGRGLVNEKKAIILHHTGEYSDRQNRNTFLNSNTTDPKSTHVYIKANGEQEIYATPDDVTFHAGESSLEGRENVNDFALGIEFAGDTYKQPLTEQQLESAAQYIIPKMLAYKIPLDALYSHGDIAKGRKADINPTQKFILKNYIWNKIQSDPSLLNMYINLGLHLPSKQLSTQWK